MIATWIIRSTDLDTKYIFILDQGILWPQKCYVQEHIVPIARLFPCRLYYFGCALNIVLSLKAYYKLVNLYCLFMNLKKNMFYNLVKIVNRLFKFYRQYCFYRQCVKISLNVGMCILYSDHIWWTSILWLMCYKHIAISTRYVAMVIRMVYLYSTSIAF